MLPVRPAILTRIPGFSITPQSHMGKDDVASINFVIRRTLGTRGWVLAMMAIYWALALGAAAVTALVIRRKRLWESRMLAWLGAMLFALVTFRAAAPGSPPVGTFLDYFAVFEAVGVVAVSLAVLIVYYLLYKGLKAWSGDFFTTDPNGNFFGNPGGVRSAIFGTLEIVGLATLFAVPIGICVALYLTDLARTHSPPFSRWDRPVDRRGSRRRPDRPASPPPTGRRCSARSRSRECRLALPWPRHGTRAHCLAATS